MLPVSNTKQPILPRVRQEVQFICSPSAQLAERIVSLLEYLNFMEPPTTTTDSQQEYQELRTEFRELIAEFQALKSKAYGRVGKVLEVRIK